MTADLLKDLMAKLDLAEAAPCATTFTQDEVSVICGLVRHRLQRGAGLSVVGAERIVIEHARTYVERTLARTGLLAAAARANLIEAVANLNQQEKAHVQPQRR